jgi:hypothetical protein
LNKLRIGVRVKLLEKSKDALKGYCHIFAGIDKFIDSYFQAISRQNGLKILSTVLLLQNLYCRPGEYSAGHRKATNTGDDSLNPDC